MHNIVLRIDQIVIKNSGGKVVKYNEMAAVVRSIQQMNKRRMCDK